MELQTPSMFALFLRSLQSGTSLQVYQLLRTWTPEVGHLHPLLRVRALRVHLPLRGDRGRAHHAADLGGLRLRGDRGGG